MRYKLRANCRQEWQRHRKSGGIELVLDRRPVRTMRKMLLAQSSCKSRDGRRWRGQSSRSHTILFELN